MISNNMKDMLNRQINRELYSAYLYLGMAASAKSMGLPGFENWFLIQVQEELVHAKRMYDYVNDNGEKVILQDIETPPQDHASAIKLFEKTLEHEKFVTSLINALTKTAKKENDEKTANFLQWYVKEQVEEEEHAGGVLEKISQAIKKDGERSGLQQVDKKLAERK